MTSVPGFLTKTFEIFSSPEYSDCCGWGSNGETIIIRKIESFSKNVLPKYFKHSNFQSFVRQLNMYDFHKTVQDPNHGEFTHEFFKQNRPDLLVNIKRKANKPPEAASAPAPNKSGGKKGDTGTSGGGKNKNANNSATASATAPAISGPNTAPAPSYQTRGAVPGIANPYIAQASLANNNNMGNLAPPLHHTGGVADLDDTYFVDEDATSQIHQSHKGGAYYNGTDYGDYAAHPLQPEELLSESDHVRSELNYQRTLRENFERRMEQKLANLQVENNMLKRMFMESHHKNAVMQERMERVMKTLYTMFVGGGGNAPGLALTNKAPSMLLTDIQHFEQQRGAGTGGSAENKRDLAVLDTLGGDGPGLSLSQGRYNGSGGVSRPIALGGSSQGTTSSGVSNLMLYGDDLGSDINSTGIAPSGDLMRLDSASLERLPSLDLDELDSLGVPYNSNNSTGNIANSGAALNGSGRGGGPNGAYNNSSNNADFVPSGYSSSVHQMLRNRPLAGAALSAANSFDLAASAVTAPSLQHQSSFDSAYLPLPLPLPASETSGSGRAPAGRVLMEATAKGATSSVAGLGAGLGAGSGSSAELGALGGAVLTGITGVPLSRQKTFDYTAGAAGGRDGEGKRKGLSSTNSEEESPSKRVKVDNGDNGNGNEHELRGLEHEDVNSSLQEAQQFMDLLNRNQQTTLTRLDSLEMTIASLFDSNSHEDAATSTDPECTDNNNDNSNNGSNDSGSGASNAAGISGSDVNNSTSVQVNNTSSNSGGVSRNGAKAVEGLVN